MKKNYETPMLEVIPLSIQDIITSSGNNGSGDAVLPDDEF